MRKTWKVVLQNDHVNIVHDACKLCYLGKPCKTKKDKLEYIRDKVKNKHESVLEHSNIVIELFVENTIKAFKEYTEVLEASRNLNGIHKESEGGIYILLGGSIRAFKNIYKNMRNQNNRTARMILDILTIEIPVQYLDDFLEAGILDTKLMSLSDVHESEDEPDDSKHYKHHTIMEDDRGAFITSIDDIETLYNELEGRYSFDELLDFCTVTVFFKSISRVASHQLVRHRNAISQQSQRYVDESDALIINPFDFTEYPEFNKDKTITISDLELTFEKYCHMARAFYQELRNAGCRKEDARYALDSATETSLYMTFTYRMLFWFLQLRCDIHAQAEIRSYANSIDAALPSFMPADIVRQYLAYLTPRYSTNSEGSFDVDSIKDGFDYYSEIDEIVETREE